MRLGSANHRPNLVTQRKRGIYAIPLFYFFVVVVVEIALHSTRPPRRCPIRPPPSPSVGVSTDMAGSPCPEGFEGVFLWQLNVTCRTSSFTVFCKYVCLFFLPRAVCRHVNLLFNSSLFFSKCFYYTSLKKIKSNSFSSSWTEDACEACRIGRDRIVSVHITRLLSALHI